MSLRRTPSLRPPNSWSNPKDHLWAAVEHPWYRLVRALQSDFYRASNQHFDGLGFEPVFMPVTTGSVSSPMGLGSDSVPVRIPLYDRHVFLADSMQFHLEYLMRQGLPGVYYMMPTFRGEKSSPRHLNEFHHSEAEFLGGLEDAIAVVSDYVVALTRSLLKGHASAIAGAAGTTDHLESLLKLGRNIPRVTFDEARLMVEGEPNAVQWHAPGAFSLTAQGERLVMRKAGGIVFLTHPPHRAVPFYQAYAADSHRAQAADLLIGIGETVGCGERHDDTRGLLRALSEHGVEAGDYGWYIDLKGRFPLRTSGFGLGIERFLLWVLAHDDIRDIPLIPRIQEVESAP